MFLSALELTPRSSAPYHKLRDDRPQSEAKQLNVLCMIAPPMTSFSCVCQEAYEGHDVAKVTQNTFYCLKTVQHSLHTVSNCGYFHTCTCKSPSSRAPLDCGFQSRSRHGRVCLQCPAVTLRGSKDCEKNPVQSAANFRIHNKRVLKTHVF